MTCSYCRSLNSEEDHRCRRCGRRMFGTAVAAPAEFAQAAIQTVGANALAAARRTIEADRPLVRMHDPQPQAERPELSPQSTLFPDEPAPRRVLQFNPRGTADVAPAPSARQPRPQSRPTAGDNHQTALDFLPASQPGARTLKTTVAAVIYCDAPVASPMHRAISALLDGSMVVLGFGLFLAIFLGFAGSFAFTRQTLAMLAVSFALIGMFYGLVWALAGRETAGMHWTELRLINFNGFALDGKARALRLVGCWLSLGSGMIGNLWAMVDEESLTWHDHMSKTFPTPRDAGTPFFRPRD